MAASSQGIRTVIRIALIAVVACVVLVFIAQGVLGRIFSPRYLEGFLEENLTAAVDVEDVQVNLFARRVVLQGLTLLPRDPTVTDTEVKVGEVRLGVKVWPLFSRKLATTSFVISDPQIRMTLDQEGELSLAEIFRNPNRDHADRDVPSDEEEDLNGVLEAEENGWLAQLGETRLEGGQVEIFFAKQRQRLTIEDLTIAVIDLQFDPQDLATLNTVQMTLSGAASLRDSEEVRLMNLLFTGGAKGKLFDEETGEFEADILTDLALDPQSYLNPQVKIVKRIWSYLDRVEQWGIPLGRLPEEIRFGRSQRIVGSYRDSVVTLREPLSLSAGKWEVGLSRESWIATEDGQHAIGVEFLAGPKVSETLGGWLNALPKEAQGLARNRFVDEEQVLWRVQSSGELGEPDLEFFSQIPEAGDFLKDLEETLEDEVDDIKEKAGDFLKGFFE